MMGTMLGLPAQLDDDGVKASDLRRLLVFYLFAIFFIVAGVLASLIATQIEAGSLAKSAHSINLNGRQRMLTQRIVYLAQSVKQHDMAADPISAATASVGRRELAQAIAQFEESHALLVGPDLLGSETRALYFDTTSGPSLDVRVGAYIAAARAVLERDGAIGALERLQSLERAGLRQDLDRVAPHWRRRPWIARPGCGTWRPIR